MKRDRLYFRTSDSQICHTKKYFTDELGPGETIEVFNAIPKVIGGGVFWCKIHCFCGDDSSETCGVSNCYDYEPRNGKNGCCKHHSTLVYVPVEKIILKL